MSSVCPYPHPKTIGTELNDSRKMRRPEGRAACLVHVEGFSWFGPGLGDTHFPFRLHACLLHAEGDLGVLVAEQYVCNTGRWVARGVQMLAAISQVWVLVTS